MLGNIYKCGRDFRLCKILKQNNIICRLFHINENYMPKW